MIHIQIRLDFTNQSPCFMDDAIATLSVGGTRASADQEPPVVIADWQTKRDTNNDHAMRCDERGGEGERGRREREGESGWGCKCLEKITQSRSTLRAESSSSSFQGENTTASATARTSYTLRYFLQYAPGLPLALAPLLLPLHCKCNLDELSFRSSRPLYGKLRGA